MKAHGGVLHARIRSMHPHRRRRARALVHPRGRTTAPATLTLPAPPCAHPPPRRERYNDDVYEYRHVILPPEIAHLLPKTHLLSEVSVLHPTAAAPSAERCCTRIKAELSWWCCQVERRVCRSQGKGGCYAAAESLNNQGRHTRTGPTPPTPLACTIHLQAEWRAMGVQQSRGWGEWVQGGEGGGRGGGVLPAGARQAD